MISEKEFNQICDISHSLMSEKDVSKTRMAIPALNIIRAHPIVLNRYRNIFNGNINNYYKIKFLLKILVFTSYCLYNYLINTFFLKTKPTLNLKNQQLDLIFISHLLNSDYLSKTDDFYFGNVPKDLELKGFKTLRLYLKQFKTNAFSKSKINNLEGRFVFSNCLNFRKEFIIWKSILLESIKLFQLSTTTNTPLKKNLLLFSALDALSGHTMKILRIGLQIKSIVLEFNPKCLISPYEGHSFERISFSYAREVNPNIKCIAYQHTGVFKHSNAIFKTYNYLYNPDFILTTGYSSKKIFESKNEFKKIPIYVLGSNRGIIDNEEFYSNDMNLNNLTCLILPEGIISECELLFNLSIVSAKKFPNINFIWRLHPLITFTQLRPLIGNEKDLPKNIIISTSSLENDIKSAQLVLYRGTSAVFKAISYGLIPIYFQFNDEISIDPLWDLIDGKVIIKNEDDFFTYLNSINNDYISEIKTTLISKFRKHTSSTFSEFNFNVIEKLAR
jgi:hypothetical protein